MKIILEKLPHDVSADDIREFLKGYVDVLDLEIYTSEHRDHASAWVTIAATHAEAHWAIGRLNGRYWRERTVEVYISLFSDNR
ncbi:RNA recognition motif domain-containing protein [Aliamphritea hakodatensis]|uniref:RNA recognition motif domain-containing protein n=1 Tax=Aliamphritea hakodatensis TaxID=2895352 RepID=UPI0022FD5291|nr:RNA-binding protein [Aliamphritea hakodatensis]